MTPVQEQTESASKERLRDSFRMYASSRQYSQPINSDSSQDRYSWLTTPSKDRMQETYRCLDLELTCMEYIAKIARQKIDTTKLFLDDILPDDIIYSLSESQRMDLVSAYGLKLKTYGASHAQWNGQLVRIQKPDTLLRVIEYPNRVSADVSKLTEGELELLLKIESLDE